MAVMAKDGSRHHSASRAQLHDEMSSKKGPASVTPMKKPVGGESTSEGSPKHPAPTKMSIQDHVEMHGPAHSMEYEHDEPSGIHHVTSKHGEEENSHHHSQHKTHEAAHQHMGEAMGMNHDNENEDETAEQEETPDSQQDQVAGHRGIPGLMA